MLTKIDAQLRDYESRVGNSLQMISVDSQGRISVQDLEKALAVIKHRPDEEVGHLVIEKLDVDKDGFVELDHLLELVKEEGLGECFLDSCNLILIPFTGVVVDDEAENLLGQGKEIKSMKPRKEDIIQE